MSPAQLATADLFRQLLSDVDIPAPAKVLSRLRLDQASLVLEGAPYSLITNLAHAVYWQDIWIGQLTGRGSVREAWAKDWHVPDPTDFPALRDRFIQGVENCLAIAESNPFVHGAATDERAIHLLNSIAIHDAYHIGQIKLLKRML